MAEVEIDTTLLLSDRVSIRKEQHLQKIKRRLLQIAPFATNTKNIKVQELKQDWERFKAAIDKVTF